MKNIAIIGSSGAIGSAFVAELCSRFPKATLHAFSRSLPESTLENVTYHAIDYTDESSIEIAAMLATKESLLDLVIVATGILHDGDLMPEKSLKDLSADKFQKLFLANTITPALIAKYFLPKLNRDTPAIFAALSARVGSISDNHLGGWYAYRASKCALNMIIKNAAIEIGRQNKQAIIVALHPGTVDSNLSLPFQNNVPEGKLFTPEFSVASMVGVLEKLKPDNTGKCYAWDGEEIKP